MVALRWPSSEAVGVFGSDGRAEWESLPQWNPKLADVFGRDVRWLVESGSAPQPPVAGPGAMKGDIEVAADFDQPLAEHFDALS